MLAAMPLITVVIPFRDRPELLTRLLKSLDSGLNDRIELLFVDNNSGKEASDLVQAFAQRHMGDADFPNIRIEREERAGAAAARNSGLDKAQGKYVYFFDSDDELDTQMLRAAINMLQGANVVAVGLQTNVVMPQGNQIPKPFDYTAAPKRQIVANNYATQSLVLLTEWARTHARWDERLNYWIDWEWALRILLQRPVIDYLGGSWHHIYIHPHSITGSSYASRVESIEKAIDIAREDIINLTDNATERARLLYALDGRTLLYAGHIYNEGDREGAARLTRTVRPERLSLLRQWRLHLAYLLTRKGVRGAWRVI